MIRFRSNFASLLARRPVSEKIPDFSEIMAHLADAIALIRVSQRSLDHLEVAAEEQCLLRMGLAAMDAAYTEIDMATIRLTKRPPPGA
ncbi:MAG TPA: hypothetical protein VF745_02085 [Steroidobacteraceae bacterium]